jgi:hypothetical protein
LFSAAGVNGDDEEEEEADSKTPPWDEAVLFNWEEIQEENRRMMPIWSETAGVALPTIFAATSTWFDARGVRAAAIVFRAAIEAKIHSLERVMLQQTPQPLVIDLKASIFLLMSLAVGVLEAIPDTAVSPIDRALIERMIDDANERVHTERDLVLFTQRYGSIGSMRGSAASSSRLHAPLAAGGAPFLPAYEPLGGYVEA